MSQSVYIVGAPGTGKSTLMDLLVSGLGLEWGPPEKMRREVFVHTLLAEGEVRGVYLGVHRPEFPGTDALSASVHPQAVTWLQTAELPPLVLAEGVKLSSPKFLVHLDRVSPLLLVHLTSDPDTTAARVEGREHQLSKQYCAAGRTRAANVAETMSALGVPVLTIDTGETSPGEAAEKLLQEVSRRG